ncbi:MAG TPA: carboxymuconolactone decarboxylase family protein [Dehalococcoidia bacterium]|jgi:4-carboxymuconolactone decarboxylase|nr:carboxymuconolactone decarboxylase family protein [Dehalococcoidia bacterium]HIL19783.1 carboxymuconolactone decarboxylase family protein [Gammaproteobacteria bacterium]
MSRIPKLRTDQLSSQQLRVQDEILAGPRSSLQGPFHAWLYSPKLADPAQKLGEFCRFSSALPQRLSELAILVVARYWRAQFEWYAHAPMAISAGISAAAVGAIQINEKPILDAEDECLVYNFVSELLDSRTVSQSTYDQAETMLGRRGVVDLVGIAGYYCLVSMTLNVFEVPLPKGEVLPLSL